MSLIPTVSETSKFRNNERKNEDARHSLKHEVLKVNGASQFPNFDRDFLVRFASRQNEHKLNYEETN